MTIREEYEQARQRAKSFIEERLSKADSGTGVVTDDDAREAHRLADEAKALKQRLERSEALSAFKSALPTGEEQERGFGEKSDLSGAAAGIVSPTWSRKTMDALEDAARSRGRRGDGMKSLLGGTVDVPIVVADPVPLPENANNVLQIITTQQLSNAELNGLGNGRFDYLVQSQRENNADAVADRQTKPTSNYDWVEKSDRLRVYAHLVDSIPERFLEDNQKLQSLITGEMLNGLVAKIEEDILTGPVQANGVENFTGILNTSGIQVVDGTGEDLLATLSNGLFQLSTTGENPNAWVLHPLDLQRLMLLRENGTTGPLLFNSGRSQLAQFLGDINIVPSTKIPRGTALLGDFTYARLLTRNAGQFEMDKSGDLFEKNLVRFRLEGRYGFTVTRPSAFAKVTLPAAS